MANPTLDRTPIRFVESCTSGGALDELWDLRVDGTDDYVQSNTSFPQWDRGQAWTMFARMDTYEHGTIYGTNDGAGGINNQGLAIWRLPSTDVLNPYTWNIQLRNSIGDYLLLRFSDATVYLDSIFQITYDGSSDTSGFALYINDASKSLTSVANILTATIVNSANKYYIGKFSTNDTEYLNGNCSIREVSFVDYVKSGAELTTDHDNGTQSIGAGAWLLNVQPVYDTYITTLDSTQTFDTAAGTTYAMDIIGKPATMSLGSDFTKQI